MSMSSFGLRIVAKSKERPLLMNATVLVNPLQL